MKLELYYPVKPNFVNQPFGAGAAYYAKYGLKAHNGIDFRAYHGQPIYAAHDGYAYYEQDTSGGHGVVIISDKTFDYRGQQVYAKTISWHFCDPAKEPKFKSPITAQGFSELEPGQYVKAGDLIGYADNTGDSTGDHLHFGFKPIVKSSSGWVNIEQENGFKGAINPEPYFTGAYAEDMGKLSLLQRLAGLYQQVLALTKLKRW